MSVTVTLRASGGATYVVTLPDPAISTSQVNVRNFGAVGNGTTDDSAAIKAAQAALAPGKTLYFPAGSYRFAQQNPAGGAAIFLNKISNVGVEFAAGAQLLMDNLSNGSGTGHGIRIVGKASNIQLINPTIAWKVRPSNRSNGSGIHVTGYPSDSAPVSGWTGSTGKIDFLTITNGRVTNAPQTGAVIHGVSDVSITGFVSDRTLADGLHFNACRRVTVRDYNAISPGDDGLAFVTYYDPTRVWNSSSSDGPFNQPTLGDWNDTNSTATNITVSNGSANGIRVQGGLNITFNTAHITNCWAACIINSGIVGNGIGWSGLAPKGIVVNDLSTNGGNSAVEIQAGNVTINSPAMYYQFDVKINRLVRVNTPNGVIYTAGQIGTTPALVTAMKAGVVVT